MLTGPDLTGLTGRNTWLCHVLRLLGLPFGDKRSVTMNTVQQEIRNAAIRISEFPDSGIPTRFQWRSQKLDTSNLYSRRLRESWRGIKRLWGTRLQTMCLILPVLLLEALERIALRLEGC